MPITKTCPISGKEFTITDFEIALLEKISPVIGGEKFPIPLPTLSPEERMRRRLQFKNYFNLFKRSDSKSGKEIISIHRESSPYTIYSQEYWWNGGWNAFDYGQTIDYSSNILDQIHHIFLTVPAPTLENNYNALENSDYVNGNGKSKDCYLISNSLNCEKCLYGWFLFDTTNMLDVNYARWCENCSYSEHLYKCFDVHHSWDAAEDRNCRYIFSCDGCQYILGGVGLKNQKYQILNVPCTPLEFETTLEKLTKDSQFRKDFEKKVQELIKKMGVSPSITTRSIDSSGDFCYNSKNITEGFNIGGSEDSAYIYDSIHVYDSMDINQWGDQLSLSYDSVDVGENSSNMYFCESCWSSAKYNFYSLKCKGCSYIFGCSGLMNQSYCIFNIQYTPEAWEETMKKILHQMQKDGSWGEFLPTKYAMFPYNDSLAMDRMPLARTEATKRGLAWSDEIDPPPPNITKIIPGEKLPESIEGIPDDVLSWAIKCTKTGKLFKIQPIELEMLRRYGIPLPKIHPIERIKMRFGWDERVFNFDF